MVQARQFRKSHEDAHYAAAVFCYQRVMAVEFKEFRNFVTQLPCCCGRTWKACTGVSRGSKFEVGDHDFTAFSIIPSVCLLVDIPLNVELSWYTGTVLVGLKEAAFEASNPQRHCKELCDILATRSLHMQPFCMCTKMVVLTIGLRFCLFSYLLSTFSWPWILIFYVLLGHPLFIAGVTQLKGSCQF